MGVTWIVSGGQTGVDRAGLDVALELGIPCGGWCPRGRRAEDGALAECYPLKETPDDKYAQRTAWNVRDADGTLVLHLGVLEGGTAETIAVAERHGKPYLVLDLDQAINPAAIHAWIAQHHVAVLNIAGPRESTRPGIYARARRLLERVLAAVTKREA